MGGGEKEKNPLSFYHSESKLFSTAYNQSKARKREQVDDPLNSRVQFMQWLLLNTSADLG